MRKSEISLIGLVLNRTHRLAEPNMFAVFDQTWFRVSAYNNLKGVTT